MKKLTLQLDDLRVDSFATTPAERGSGTVFGEQCTCWTNCTCPGCPTCDATCDLTCGVDCGTFEGYTCENSCQGGYSCDPTCETYVTIVHDYCMIC
jgi:hypothetical protein